MVNLKLKLIYVFFSVVIGYCNAYYTVKDQDMSDPACKVLLNQLMQYDRKFMNLTAYFPKLAAILDKYPSNRRKRDLSSSLDKLDAVMKHAIPCGKGVLRYIRYWIHDVIGPIFVDQMKRFLV